MRTFEEELSPNKRQQEKLIAVRALGEDNEKNRKMVRIELATEGTLPGQTLSKKVIIIRQSSNFLQGLENGLPLVVSSILWNQQKYFFLAKNPSVFHAKKPCRIDVG